MEGVTTVHGLADSQHFLIKCSVQSTRVFIFIGIDHQFYRENQKPPRVYFLVIHFTTVTTLAGVLNTGVFKITNP